MHSGNYITSVMVYVALGQLPAQRNMAYEHSWKHVLAKWQHLGKRSNLQETCKEYGI